MPLPVADLFEVLTYERHNHNMSVHGYQEEGTITTPFDMRVQNKIDRFKGAHLIQKMIGLSFVL